jgi:phosphoribosylformylglycinamidine synthase
MSTADANRPATLPTDPPITPELIAKHGIQPDEYEHILEILGREPNFTELGIFSVMWSEHCSYKNSKPELKKFPTTGDKVLVKAGEENAGVLDIGDGWAISFKMESHNHPSAVEPFQGAATGVGGIIRDIFTMGARPVFNMNSLRFGPICDDGSGTVSPERTKRNRRLFSGVVAGIAHYGNCIGIPTVGGEIYFDESYEGNPLVNVFCLGVLKHEQIRRGAAKGIGNPVFYVGAETGRDGLAGAAFASRELTEESKADRPAVQVGDPFREKLLLEACLELFESEWVAGVQDMGAAGLTCSTCETASRGNTGVEIDLSLVPQREKHLTPYEILLSESQERMLIIVTKGGEAEVERIFQKWDLPYAMIGEVKDDGMMRVKNHGVTVAEIPARRLAEDGPVYHREVSPRVTPPEPVWADLPVVAPAEALPRLLANPSLASKNWVYRQYDHMVQTGTVGLPGSDAAVFYVREADKYLAATTDCNALYCLLNPREGGKLAVMEAVRNITCSGAVPLALTDNLNFGNPYKPENFWQLRECVEGLAEGCRVFGTPVTGGNVSLYNESPAAAVDPTPTVGVVGLIEDPKHITGQAFPGPGLEVWLIGGRGSEMGGSHWLKVLHGQKAGQPPRADLENEKKILDALRDAIRAGFVASAHDCSEGGLAVALAECTFGSALTAPVGAKIDLAHGGPGDAWEATTLLFNESQGRIILSVHHRHSGELAEHFCKAGVPAEKIGVTGGDRLEIGLGGQAGVTPLSWSVQELRKPWWSTIGECMGA